MEYTLITDFNYRAFEDLLFDRTGPEDKGILRIGTVDQGVAVGALSAGFRDQTCQIRSLYVVSPNRRRGLAGGMLKKLRDLLGSSPISVLSCSFSSDAEGMAPFLEREGFLIRENEGYYQTNLETLMTSGYVHKYCKMNTLGLEHRPLEAVSKPDRNRIISSLRALGYGRPFTDLASYDQRLSGAVFDYDGTPRHCLLASSRDDRAGVFVSLLASLDRQQDFDTKSLLAQFKGFYEALQTEYRGREELTDIRFAAENRDLMPFLRKVVGKEGIQQISTDVSAVSFI